MTTRPHARDDVESLPPSCRCVLLVLDEEATRQQLLEQTGLPETTLDDALDTLENRDFIRRTRKSDDLRQVVAISTDKRTLLPPDADT